VLFQEDLRVATQDNRVVETDAGEVTDSRRVFLLR
jgi:hypothetical protein